MHKPLPFSKSQIETIIQKYPTPFHIYDEKAIRDNARHLNQVFSWMPGFKNYFAVKALPNPFILKLLVEEGFGADCSSLGELIVAEKVGLKGEDIMFSSNDTPVADFKKALELGAIINFDDISHVEYFEKNVGKLPDLCCFRYNPGPLKGGNAIIGEPKEAKYGLTTEQIFEGYKMLKQKGIKRFGIHTMVASNEIIVEYFTETVTILFDLVGKIHKELGINFDFINLGGGLGIPYRPEQDRLDIVQLSSNIKALYEEKILKIGHPPLKVIMESGRYITGPYGYLVTRVIHEKHIYKDYIGLDACMANLMRPAVYGAYHHITVLGKENAPLTHTYDVTGSLCENNDKFAIDRKLPEIEIGDLLVIHDTGAHGHAMGFQYNAKLRSAELLLQPDGSVRQIRRAETLDDYFATIDFSQL